MKLISSKIQEFIPGSAQRLSMDELYELGAEFGKWELGSWGAQNAELKLNFVGDDFVILKEKDSQDIRVNMGRCIERAREFKQFYSRIR